MNLCTFFQNFYCGVNLNVSSGVYDFPFKYLYLIRGYNKRFKLLSAINAA